MVSNVIIFYVNKILVDVNLYPNLQGNLQLDVEMVNVENNERPISVYTSIKNIFL